MWPKVRKGSAETLKEQNYIFAATDLSRNVSGKTARRLIQDHFYAREERCFHFSAVWRIRIILIQIRIRIQDVKKFVTDPDPG